MEHGAPATDPAVVKDIFALIEEMSQDPSYVEDAGDSELLFVGSKQAGKSTLMHSFLMKDETPKPTTALEYRFARRTTGANSAATVANLWELGGGTQLCDLMKVVMLPERLPSCVVAVVLDLGCAGDALSTMLTWFDQIRKQVDRAMTTLSSSASGQASAKALRARRDDAWADHADRDRVVPLGVPVVVLAHKWDAFEEQHGEPEYRKLLARVLRYFAHANGASLVATKQKDKQMLTTMRNMLYHHVFETSAVKTVQLEHSRPLVVPAGADSFDGIGPPPRVEGCISDEPGELWKAAYEATFPPKAARKEAQDLSMVEAEQFAEESIDELRRQKREELVKMRKDMEQEARMTEGVTA